METLSGRKAARIPTLTQSHSTTNLRRYAVDLVSANLEHFVTKSDWKSVPVGLRQEIYLNKMKILRDVAANIPAMTIKVISVLSC